MNFDDLPFTRMPNPLPCGCGIKGAKFMDWRGEKMEYRDIHVEFCPLHAAASKLLAALTEARCWLGPGTAEARGAKCETKGEMFELVEAAIARAEQHTNPNPESKT